MSASCPLDPKQAIQIPVQCINSATATYWSNSVNGVDCAAAIAMARILAAIARLTMLSAFSDSRSSSPTNRPLAFHMQHLYTQIHEQRAHDEKTVDGPPKRVSKTCDRWEALKAKCDGRTPCDRCLVDNLPCHRMNTRTTFDEQATETYEQHGRDTDSARVMPTLLEEFRLHRGQLALECLKEIRKQLEQNDAEMVDLDQASSTYLERLCQKAGIYDGQIRRYKATDDEASRLQLVAHQLGKSEGLLNTLGDSADIHLKNLYRQRGMSDDEIHCRSGLIHYNALRTRPLSAPLRIDGSPDPNAKEHPGLVKWMKIPHASNERCKTDLSEMAISATQQHHRLSLTRTTVLYKKRQPLWRSTLQRHC